MSVTGRDRARRKNSSAIVRGAARCRRKFLRFYPGGFRDADYLALERDYKWRAYQRWTEILDAAVFRDLLRRGDHVEIARRAVGIEISNQPALLFREDGAA